MSDVGEGKQSADDASDDHPRERETTTAASVHRPDGEPGSAEQREFGRRGWLLLATIFVAFVVVPALIYVRPPGVSFTFAYLVLPLVPATVLALLAVWVAVR